MEECKMEFQEYMINDHKSEGTISKYTENVGLYKKWYEETYGEKMEKLYRPNVLEFKSYLKNNKQLNGKTVNGKLSALLKYNEYLIDEGIQTDTVINKKDFISIQTNIASPTTRTKADVEKFRQTVLVNEGTRNFAIVTVLTYAGLRISEALSLKMGDFNLTTKEIIVRNGKGEKQRTVYLNDKIIEAVRAYLKERVEDGTNYLFLSNKGGMLSRSTINKMFNKYSDEISPHELRHSFCTMALEKGFSLHETACMAGHSNVSTTMQYANPNITAMKEKMNLL
jgi:site-specific recombinase XerD